MDKLLNFIIQPILGAAAGYITNEYAINMLFKTYTPLKLGGVIPKTREQFIENISNLLVDDIINKEKIEAILNDKAFIRNFDSLVEDFFTRSIYEVTDNVSIGSISSISKALEDADNFFSRQIQLELPEIIRLTADEVRLDCILDKNQTDNLAQNLYANMSALLRDTELADKILNNTVNKNENISLMDIAGFDVCAVISQNISDIFLNSSNIRINYDENITMLINDILKRTNIFDLSFKLAEKIAIDNKNKIQDNISDILTGFIKSDAYKDALLSLCGNIVDYAKSLDIPLISLLNENFTDNLKKIISTKSPELFELVISLVSSNEDELRKIIEESIDETINEQDSTKRALLGMAKKSIINSIIQNDISDIVSEYLRNDDNTEVLCFFALSKAKHYLETVSISDALKLLEEKAGFTAKVLSDFLAGYFLKNIPSLSKKITEQVLASLKSKSVINRINTGVTDIIKDKFIFSDKTVSIVNTNLSIHLAKLFDTSLSDILSDLFDNGIKERFFSDLFVMPPESGIMIGSMGHSIGVILENNRDTVTKYLSSNINKYIENKKLSDILSSNLTSEMNKLLYQSADKGLHEIKEKISKEEFYELFNKINSIDNIHSNTSKMLKNGVIDNLGYLLHKFIKGASVNNLNKLDDTRLIEMAKSFMGNNLKPIMLFGGMLGLAAGIILAMFGSNANAFAPVSFWGALTYSLVGFMTNAIAINMLFKPYKEIRSIKNVPFLRHFSLGYIVKNKKNLAESMSSAINEYLLTKDSLNEIIDAYKINIKSGIINSVSNNNYEILSAVFSDNKEKLIASASAYTLNALKSNADKISTIAASKADKIKLNDFAYEYREKISEHVISSKEKYNNLILSQLIKLSDKNTPISSILPKRANGCNIAGAIKKSVNRALYDGYDMITDKINFENAKNIFAEYDHKYQEAISTRNLSDILSQDSILSYISTDMLIKKANSMLGSSVAIGDMLDKRISEMSNGALYSFFEDVNINSMTLLKLIKPPVSKAVQNKVRSNLSFLLKGAYSMMGGDKIVDAAVEKALLEKFPKLIEAKKDSIHEKISDYLNNKLLRIKLNDFGLSLSPDVSKIIPDDSIKNILGPLVSYAEKKASSVFIKDLLKPLSMDSIQSIFSTYEKELRTLIEEINFSFASNKNDIVTSLTDFIDSYIDDLLNNTDICKLFENINSNDFKTVSDNITKIFLNDELIAMNIKDILEIIRDFKPIYLSELMKKDDFEVNLKKIICDLSNDDKLKEALYKSTANIISRAFENNLEFIDNSAKEYITGIVSDAAILSLRNNLSDILKDIEFDKIAKNQIEEMSPKKIHMMFDSFAGKYFKTLMLYGLFGAVFGINTVLGLLLSGIYGIKAIKKK